MAKQKVTLASLPRLIVPVKDLVMVVEALEYLKHELARERVESILENCPEWKEKADASDNSNPDG